MIVVVLCGAVSLLLGCRSGSRSLAPNDKGRTWNYSIVLETPSGKEFGKMEVRNLAGRELFGKSVIPRSQTINGKNAGMSFVVSDASGVYEIASQQPGDETPKQTVPPNYDFKLPLSVGTSWEGQDETDSDAFLDKVQVKTKCLIEKLDDEVTVPAGTYKATKVSCTGSAQRDMKMQGLTTTVVESHTWYAPDIGLVKSIDNEDIRNANSVILHSIHGTRDLVSMGSEKE